jgi:hypothetical protein
LCFFLLAPALAWAQSATAAADGSILAPVNRELPSWFRLSGEYRARAEGYEGAAYTAGNNQGYLLSRLMLNADLQVSWFRVFAQAIDSRVLGNDAIPQAFPYQNTFDLHQAFLQIGRAEKNHWSVIVGRQELKFGNQRTIGSANWLNTPRSFDAARADFDLGKFHLAAFSAAVVNPVNGAFDHSKAGNDLHGLYGTISRVLPGATLEPYFLWHLGGGLKTEEGLAARRSTKTVALRIARPAKDRIDYTVHVLRQYGSIGEDAVSAYAMNFNLGYTWSHVALQPHAYVDYAYSSGDRDPHDGTINTFDQIYPSNHGLYGIIDLFGWQNLQDTKAGVSFVPAKKLTVASAFHYLNLASSTDALYNGQGNVVARNTAGQDGKHIGEEWEVTGGYQVTTYLASGIGYGHLFPGEFIHKATKGSPYDIAYLFLTYTF